MKTAVHVDQCRTNIGIIGLGQCRENYAIETELTLMLRLVGHQPFDGLCGAGVIRQDLAPLVGPVLEDVVDRGHKHGLLVRP